MSTYKFICVVGCKGAEVNRQEGLYVDLGNAFGLPVLAGTTNVLCGATGGSVTAKPEIRRLTRYLTIECDSISAVDNGDIGGASGAARCIALNWNYLDSAPTTVQVLGGSYKNVWGDDGDVIQVAQQDGIYNHNRKFIVQDAYIGFSSRRLLKATASGVELVNNTFEPANADNPNIHGAPPAGILAFGLYSADHSSSKVKNIKLLANRFDARGNNLNGSNVQDKRLVFNDTDGVLIDNNHFMSTRVIFKQPQAMPH